MGTLRTILYSSVGIACTSVSAWHTAGTVAAVQTQSQPGTPSKQPEPKNTQPRPRNTQPAPKNPIPRPDKQDPTPDPNSPGSPGAPSDRTDRPTDARDNARTPANARNLRAFALQSPDMEGRFNIATRRLVQMEQRMQQSQQDLLKRLGEARQLSGERQTNALFDVIQQMMKEQAELQRYLSQSRAVWTGDVDVGDGTAPADDEAAVPTDEHPER
jgi:hypothetical protein